jgi:hypothetical protein
MLFKHAWRSAKPVKWKGEYMKKEKKTVHFLAVITLSVLAMIPVMVQAADSPYDGWWYTADQDGTGISIEIQGNILFMAWYTYNQSGQPIWHISGGPMSSATHFEGTLKLCTGTPLSNLAGWAPYVPTDDGTVQITFTSANQATLSWSGVQGTYSGNKPIIKFMEAMGSGGCLDTRDINGWWWDPAYDGMGFFIEARGGSLFMAWYHYRDDGSTRWWTSYSNPGAFPSGSDTFNSTFHLYTAGQYIGGNWQQNTEQASPSTVNNLTFVSFTEATLTWSGGPMLNLERFWFGGLAGLPAISYIGKSTAATIDECNAVAIAGQAVRGTYVVSLFKDLIPAEPLSASSAHTTYAMAWFSPMYWLSLLQDTPSGHVPYEPQTQSDTIDGGCGGTLAYSVTTDDATNAFSGSFTATNFCNNAATLNGNATISGNVSLEEPITANLLLTLNQFTLKNDPKSDVTVNGTVTGVMNETAGISATIEVLKRNNNLGKVFRINNYVVTILSLQMGDTIEGSAGLTGRFYHPDYGYVDLSAPAPIQVSIDENFNVAITSGTIVCTGNANTKAKLTILSPTTFKVEADTNGDGIYEWDSGPLNISDYE